MIERDEAFRLVSRWGRVENEEMRRLWYRGESAGTEDWRGGYREEGEVHVGRSELECTGRALHALRERYPRDHEVLVKRFRDGVWMGPRATDRALDAFALVYSPVPKAR